MKANGIKKEIREALLEGFLNDIFKQLARQFNIKRNIERMIRYYRQNKEDEVETDLDESDAKKFILEGSEMWIDHFEDDIEIIINLKSFYVKLELSIKDFKYVVVALMTAF